MYKAVEAVAAGDSNPVVGGGVGGVYLTFDCVVCREGDLWQWTCLQADIVDVEVVVLVLCATEADGDETAGAVEVPKVVAQGEPCVGGCGEGVDGDKGVPVGRGGNDTQFGFARTALEAIAQF